jgi:hypothetical protein
MLFSSRTIAQEHSRDLLFQYQLSSCVNKQLLPKAVVDDVPADHLAQFVVALARERLDLSEIIASYKSGLSQSRVPTTTLIGKFSSMRRA